MEYDSRIPGYEAQGFCSPSSSAFIVRADALQKCNWLPMYSRAPHLALGQELKLQEYLCHYINMPLAVGESPAIAAAAAPGLAPVCPRPWPCPYMALLMLLPLRLVLPLLMPLPCPCCRSCCA